MGGLILKLAQTSLISSVKVVPCFIFQFAKIVCSKKIFVLQIFEGSYVLHLVTG